MPQNQHIDLFNEAIQIGLKDPDPDVESTAQVAREILDVYTSKDEQLRTSSPKRKINIMNAITNQIYESRVYELSQPLLKSQKPISAERKEHHFSAFFSLSLSETIFSESVQTHNTQECQSAPGPGLCSPSIHVPRVYFLHFYHSFFKKRNR